MIPCSPHTDLALTAARRRSGYPGVAGANRTRNHRWQLERDENPGLQGHPDMARHLSLPLQSLQNQKVQSQIESVKILPKHALPPQELSEVKVDSSMFPVPLFPCPVSVFSSKGPIGFPILFFYPIFK